MKAATCIGQHRDPYDWISIHAAREGGDPANRALRDSRSISIHAAREGGDPVIIALYNDVFISIHAAREGGDADICRNGGFGGYFNPRRP